MPLPHVTHVFCGRNIGYAVERIDLNDRLQAISAMQQRRMLGAEPVQVLPIA